MAKKVQKRRARVQQKKTTESPFKIYWEKQNYILLLIGFIFLLIGFYLLAQGPWDSTTSLVLSPIFLFIAYIIIFPASIFFRKKREEKINKEEEIAAGKS
jgi:membrane protein YdbS with pleckstrin-like domain